MHFYGNNCNRFVIKLVYTSFEFKISGEKK
jgi:hypothetical protein